MLAERKTKLKPLLMDQKFIAGIGNVYSDEILFEAGLKWERQSDSLSQQEVRRLYRAISETLQGAVKYRGSSLADEGYVDLFGKPGEYQDHHQVYGREGESCMRCRRPIERARYSNRSTLLLRRVSGLTRELMTRARACVVSGRVQGVWFRDSCRSRRGGGVRGLRAEPLRRLGRGRVRGAGARGRAPDRLVPGRVRTGPTWTCRRRADRDASASPASGSVNVTPSWEQVRRSGERLVPAVGSPRRPRRAPTIASRRRGPCVPAIAHAEGLQVLRRQDHARFRTGVCVVVGPNGSGKSNVVDSVAWVLGAQERPCTPRRQDGRRHLRGYLRTSRARPLPRSSPTIDNTAGVLPIDFSEVTITRTFFRTGESEYMINGAPCRLLDIQELLSDTGIGRQQHVIVGQGQLDAVLNARPEDRRAIIEEAAGILKFRKRREKAQRRLEATEGNLLRLTDLLREVGASSAPLERQADAARRHDGIVEELRVVTLHLAGREIDRLQIREQRRADLWCAGEGRARPARAAARPRRRGDRRRAGAVGPGWRRRRRSHRPHRSIARRSRGLTNLVAERRRGLERELAAVADEGVVETLVAEAARTCEQLRAVDLDVEALAPRRRRRGRGRVRPGYAPRTIGNSAWVSRPPSPRAAAPRPSSPTRSVTATRASPRPW